MLRTNTHNKIIAKNTILLYIRTIIVLLITLYTSRLILKALGAEDLGVYNVVCGIVALMVFFRTSLSKATSRFVTFEIGRGGDSKSLSLIFSSAMTNHLIIAGLAIALGETIGLLILNNWTEIPLNRQGAAFWVYQCALVIFLLQIITAPYEAIIIAYEDMSVFAYISILSALLKLVISLILLNSESDRLVMYGALMVIMDLIVFIIYLLYNRHNYPLFHFKPLWDKQYSKKMFTFSGWTLFGSSANATTQQGISLLFNNYVGLIANTALGFAYQVNGSVSQFVNSFQTAFNPQIIKFYAQKDWKAMDLLIQRGSKYSFLLAYVFALPLIANMDFVLKIWLGNVPLYTVEFCQLILCCCIIDSSTGVFNTAITATGNIKGFQLGISISFLLDLVTASVLLYYKLNPALVFGSRILTRGLLNMLIMLYFMKSQLSFNLFNYFVKVLVPILTTILVTVPIATIISYNYNEWARLIITVFAMTVIILIATWFFFLSKNEKKIVSTIIKEKIINRE